MRPPSARFNAPAGRLGEISKLSCPFERLEQLLAILDEMRRSFPVTDFGGGLPRPLWEVARQRSVGVHRPLIDDLVESILRAREEDVLRCIKGETAEEALANADSAKSFAQMLLGALSEISSRP